MSDSVNPFESPGTVSVPVKPLAQGDLSETMVFYLKGASPWLRFVGILGFIGAALMVLWGIVFVAILPMLGQGTLTEIPGFEEFNVQWNGAFGGSMAILFLGIGALMFFPSLFIYRFGEKIRSYLRTGAEQDLELAFKNNKSLWKFLGILSIIELAFVPVLIIGGIIIAVAAVLN